MGRADATSRDVAAKTAAANTAYQLRWRPGRTCGEPSTPTVAVSLSPVTPGPVEVGVEAEIGSSAEARPGLAQIGLALADLAPGQVAPGPGHPVAAGTSRPYAQ